MVAGFECPSVACTMRKRHRDPGQDRKQGITPTPEKLAQVEENSCSCSDLSPPGERRNRDRANETLPGVPKAERA